MLQLHAQMGRKRDLVYHYIDSQKIQYDKHFGQRSYLEKTDNQVDMTLSLVVTSVQNAFLTDLKRKVND